MTPQERIRRAQELHRRAKYQPGLPMSLRAKLRRVANNLVRLNMMEASKRPAALGVEEPNVGNTKGRPLALSPAAQLRAHLVAILAAVDVP